MVKPPHISVIIPVYNAEAHLARCMDSVCGQTLQEIEIICIDDASTDASLSILREYAAEDARVKIVSLAENCGPGGARNVGITRAHGEYLGFVDSDDDVSDDFYENLYTKALSSGADIVKGSFYEINGTEAKPYFVAKERTALNKILIFSLFSSAYSAIYRRTKIISSNALFLHNVRLGEDTAFELQAIAHANTIALSNNGRYNYHRRSNSLHSAELNMEQASWVQTTACFMLNYINTAPLTYDEYKVALYKAVSILCRLPSRVSLKEQTAVSHSVSSALLHLFTQGTDKAVDLLHKHAIYKYLEAEDADSLAEYLKKTPASGFRIDNLRARVKWQQRHQSEERL